MASRRRRKSPLSSLFSFIITFAILSAVFENFEIWVSLLLAALVGGVAFLIGHATGKNAAAKETSSESAKKTAPRTTGAQKTQKASSVTKTETVAEKPKTAAPKKSYGPEIDPIIEEGNRALSEMGRLYLSIKDPEVKQKVNELMRITDKIVQDAIADPSDIPQIKKFLNYYLPTTIKLLNTYDRMSAQGIEGENLDKSMKSINEMLDTAIEAFKRHLDSLFDNQALDIETEIDVMNKMLAREGLTGQKDFVIKPQVKEKTDKPMGQTMVQEMK
ncbi:MAG: 5-bromo-4-chloroindolyl phosphate hydrolysis family protein [Oscillospiraceae bacterium]|nr:5-bromo-4-chloroindolyl phosphate hydrolysis family protein [Oscillospiraceae bacterium]MBQ6465899.1 5-bromo-4-chloroindolyl phosphate hydrolysis family protein [Oscillospiraceae bacterium]